MCSFQDILWLDSYVLELLKMNSLFGLQIDFQGYKKRLDSIFGIGELLNTFKHYKNVVNRLLEYPISS